MKLLQDWKRDQNITRDWEIYEFRRKQIQCFTCGESGHSSKFCGKETTLNNNVQGMASSTYKDHQYGKDFYSRSRTAAEPSVPNQIHDLQ